MTSLKSITTVYTATTYSCYPNVSLHVVLCTIYTIATYTYTV